MSMAMGTSFLGGAKDRLLPPSVPFRFFITAALFHVAAWATLLFGAADVAEFTGGLGLILAALHLATLGVFGMAAMGASYQLLPVVTRQPLASIWPATLSFWFFAFGVLILCYGMGAAHFAAMQAGGVLVTAGLSLFALLTARNLGRAGSVAAVAGHGWAALVALVVLVVLGLVLIWDFSSGFLDDHAGLAVLHMVVALFGFMGLLVAGFSMVLIPMFVLSRSLPSVPGWVGLALGITALIAFTLAIFTGNAVVWWLALGAGFGTAATHAWLMYIAESRSMRKRLGLSFTLIRAARYILLATLVLTGAVWAGLPMPNAPALIGFAFVAGWLLTFLMGILQRILPFLASMHASGASGLPMLISDLTAQTPLRIHTFAHFAAITVVAAGIVMANTLIIQLGAAIGVIGAIAFAIFAINVALKLYASQTTVRDANSTTQSST